MKKALSIVIPVYNEPVNIIKTLRAIKKYVRTPHEIIVVYDDDDDTTLRALKLYRRTKNLFIVKNIVAVGPSGALRTGFFKASAPRVLVMMADLCDDVTQIDSLVALVPKKAAVVVPSRYSQGGRQELKDSHLKVWAPRLAGRFLKLIAGIPTYDPTNSFKLYSQVLLQKLTLTSTVSFSVTLEIIVKAHALGYNIVEVPTVWKDRQHGKSKFKFWTSVAVYLPWLLYAFSHRKK